MEIPADTFHTLEAIAIVASFLGNIIFMAIKISGRLSIMENDIRWIKGHLRITVPPEGEK